MPARCWTSFPQVLAMAIALVVAPSFAARALDASLTVFPTTADGRIISATDPVDIRASFRAGDEQLSNIVLSAFSNDGITATVDGAEQAAAVPSLLAKGEHVWKLRLVPKGKTI